MTNTITKITFDGEDYIVGGSDIVYITQAEYNALPSSKLTDGRHYYIFSGTPVTGVTLNESQISLSEVGDTYQLTATVIPNDAYDTSVTWSSSDTTIATVSQSGLVTCVTPGTCTITVTTTDGGFTATCGVDSGGWTPGANTLAYRPLNSQYGLQEITGHLTSVTSGCTIGDYTVGGVTVNCGYFNNTAMVHTSGLTIPNQFTVSFWKYDTGSGEWSRPMSIAKSTNLSVGSDSMPRYMFLDVRGSKGMLCTLEQDQASPYYSNIEPYTNVNQVGGWYHTVLTVDVTNRTMKMYSNTSLGTNATKTGDISPSYTASGIYLGSIDNNFVGYLSNVIIESGIWTAQDVSDYYDLTKGDYGIS